MVGNHFRKRSFAATVGIILGMLSKPKKVKLKDENKEKQLTKTE